MTYSTVQDKANEWGISQRQIQNYCKQDRIDGAIKKSGIWLVPSEAIKPSNIPFRPKLEELRVLSLFSGCGGMDLGFEGGFKILKPQYNPRISIGWGIKNSTGRYIKLPKTRFKTVFANDIRPDAQVAWSKFFKGKKDVYLVDSVVDLVKLHKDNNKSIFPKNVDIVTGGFPCQDFSVAGKRLGFNSDKSHTGSQLNISEPTKESRGTLYMWMREVVAIVQPKVFVAENVKGLTNLGDAKRIIEADFSSIGGEGYFVFPARVLMAADYGVAQSRERVIFIGLKKSALRKKVLSKLQNEFSLELDPYPQPTHSQDGIPYLLPYVSVGEVLKDLDEPNKSVDLDQQRYSKAKFMGKHCQGQNEIILEKIAPTIRSEHHGNIEFRRLSAENGGRYLDELANGAEQRRLSVRECARIQSFPDEYKFSESGISASNAYKLIGNAVPPLLAFHIAKRLEELWPVYFSE